MIFIDTNTLYYASEISQNEDVDVEKLKEYIKFEDIAISSVSIYEFIMKYRRDIETVHKVGWYLGENHIKIAFNRYFPQYEGFNPYLSDVTHEQLEYMVSKIKSNKIDIESKFTAMIFDMCFFSGAYFTGVEDETVSDMLFDIMMHATNLVAIGSVDAFRKFYEEGYETDDCENYIRKEFNGLLQFFFQCLIPFIEQVKDFDPSIDFKEFMDTTDWNSLSQRLEKIDRSLTSTNYLKKIAVKYWKEADDDHLEKFLKDFDKTIQKIPESSLQEYLREIIKNCCINGGSFWKNDILDAIILCNLQEEHKMVTFDKGAIRHMEKYKSERSKYAESLELINSFYK